MIKYRTATIKEPYTVCDKCKQVLKSAKYERFGTYGEERNIKYVEISVIHNIRRTIFSPLFGIDEREPDIEKVRNVQLCYDCIEKFEKWLDEE